MATGGGGWHLYYRHPGGPTLPALPGAAGIDIKGDGGYVAAPPSVHPGTGQPYRWVGGRGVAEMPPALRAALTPPPAPAARRRLSARPCTGPRSGGHLITPRPAGRAPARRRRTPPKAAAAPPSTARPGASPGWSPPGPSPTAARAALEAAGTAAQQTPREIRAAIDGAFTDEGAAA